jgi:hypothetical protein
MTEQDQLTQLCERLGAPPAQAAAMAAQLLKRAGQIAEERKMTREEALRGLIEVVIKGRAGELPGAFRPKSLGTESPGT